jgi:hypothetical protein
MIDEYILWDLVVSTEKIIKKKGYSFNKVDEYEERISEISKRTFKCSSMRRIQSIKDKKYFENYQQVSI